MPLLHPARTLPQGDVRMMAGTSAQFAGGALATAVAQAREEASQRTEVPGPPGTDPTYARGALVVAAVAPGMAPVLGGRVGIGSRFEGGLATTGRAARVDIRRAFAMSDAADFSMGLGASAPFYGGDSGSLPNVDLAKLRGYGVDLPLLVGWESQAGLYKVWAGGRAGYDRVSLENVSSDPRPGVPGPGIGLKTDRFWAGGVLGLMVGFRHLHVALEVQAAYVALDGTYNENAVKLSGFSLTPATALSWEF